MKSFQMKLLLFTLTVLTPGLWFTSAYAQTGAPIPKINTTININEYDILFLTDILDAKTQKLNPATSGFSVDLAFDPTLDVQPPPRIRIYMKVLVQLRGVGSGTLLEGYSDDIPFNGRLTLSARDFSRAAGGGAVIDQNYYENSDLKKRISNFAETSATAPPGTYNITVKVVPPKVTNTSVVYGTDSKTIVIPYSSLENAFIEVTDPKNGSIINTLVPTFSWTTGAPNVTVRVYEAGVNHRSPQDALTGSNPYLEKDLSGTTTLTYPQDAKRQLQDNKAYVLQIEARVSSNRGELGNFSRPVVFRITNDRIGTMMDNFLNTYSGDASATFATLRADPNNWVAWPAYGNITLDGSTITDIDLQALINDLTSRPELKLQLSIENQ